MKRVTHCSHWGAYTLDVDDGRITAVNPFPDDPEPSAITKSVSAWMDPARRILQPIVRAGWLNRTNQSDARQRGVDRFVAVSWDEAVQLVTDEINRVRNGFGNASIFAGSYGWTSCGRFHHAATLLKRMLGLVGGYTDHVDTYSLAAGPVILRHVLGSDEACYAQGSTLDTVVDHTDVLIVFGGLSPRTAQNEAGGVARHGLSEHLQRLAKRGARIIHISPLKSDVPSWLPVEWWPIRPQSDTALMLGLAGEIVSNGKHDRSFLEQFCSGSGDFLAYLDGSKDGTPKTADWASRLTDIPASDIRALAKSLPRCRSMVTVSWSLQRAQHGEQPYWAAIGLASILGQLGLPGGGVAFGYGSSAGSGMPIGIGRSPGMRRFGNPANSFIPVARVADMLLNPGSAYTYEGQARTYPDVRLVYWAGGNPFHHHQDLNRLAEAWKKPETIIVQDPMWTATALRADIVLPATTSLERNDIAGTRRSGAFVAMQKAMEPLGEARSDYEIFRAIARRLGVGEAFSEGRDEMAWLRHLYDQSKADIEARAGYVLPDFGTFWNEGHTPVPAQSNYTYLAAFRADPERQALKTSSGRIVLGSPDLKALNHSDCPEHPSWIEPMEWLGQPNKAGRLQLLSHQPAGRLHSQLDHGPASLAEKRDGREQARLHPKEAERRGIANGSLVRISTARGACLATATVDADVRPGVIVLPTGAWFSPTQDGELDLAGNPNVLTRDVPSSQFGQGCAAYTCMVDVEPYDADAEGPDVRYGSQLRTMLP